MTDDIRTDITPMSASKFVKKYPGYFTSLRSLNWALNQRASNGMLESGAVVEGCSPVKPRLKIIPAKMHAHLSGDEIQEVIYDSNIDGKLLEILDRLAVIEQRLKWSKVA